MNPTGHGSRYGAAAAKLQALAERNREKWAHIADTLSPKCATTRSSAAVPCDEVPAEVGMFRNIQAFVTRSETAMDTAMDTARGHDGRRHIGVHRDIHMQKNAIKSIINFEIIF